MRICHVKLAVHLEKKNHYTVLTLDSNVWHFNGNLSFFPNSTEEEIRIYSTQVLAEITNWTDLKFLPKGRRPYSIISLRASIWFIKRKLSSFIRLKWEICIKTNSSKMIGSKDLIYRFLLSIWIINFYSSFHSNCGKCVRLIDGSSEIPALLWKRNFSAHSLTLLIPYIKKTL